MKPDLLLTVQVPGGPVLAQAHVRRGVAAEVKNVNDLAAERWPAVMEALVWAFANELGPDIRDWSRRVTWEPTPRGIKKVQTHCRNGHELSGDNLLYEPDRGQRKRRRCRVCRAARSRRSYVRRLVLSWHGPCPNCGQIHNPDEVSDACIDAIAETSGRTEAA